MTDIEYDVLRTAKDHKIDCAQAFAIARRHNATPGEVGKVIDELGIKIHNCQLGCFN